MTETRKFDACLAAQPQTALRSYGLMLLPGFNIGLVIPQAQVGLLGEMAVALAKLPGNGALHKAAQDA